MATGIGSFPHQDPDKACEIILSTTPKIPFWPQLPNTSFKEQMEIQYSEGLPCVVVDEEKKRMYFNTSGDITSALEEFYENYMSENLEYFRISPEYSRGIFAIEEKLKGKRVAEYFKNQVTGPVTTGLGRVDENKRSIFYNEVFQDVIVKGMEMKARWLLRKFKALECPQICFVDEPILSAFGSSTYVSVQRSDVVRQIKDVVEAVHKEGALAGSHCCGNTEWTILIDAGVDIISFDAYEYGETISYYPEQIKSFLEKGGVLAWGIIPSSEKVKAETPESLLKKLKTVVKNLASKGIKEDLIWEKCLITPSCGTGSLSVETSEKIFEYLAKVSRLLRQES